MSDKLRVFVSSVQKELEDERAIVQNLLNTDAFLVAHCAPVLFEFEPASPTMAAEGCLIKLNECQVYLLIIGTQYGTLLDDLSITHAEYRRAKLLGLPVIAFIKGERSLIREDGTKQLIAELEGDGPKYKRFGNVIELQKEVRSALVELLQERFALAPTTDEDMIAEQTIDATSLFESQTSQRLKWRDVNHDIARQLVAVAENKPAETLTPDEVLWGALLRGLVWCDPDSGEHYTTAAGIVLLANDPSAVYPQCRIMADTYRGALPDGDPRDHEDIRGPMPLVIERAIAFVDRNTRHPMRIVGLNRVRFDEYPEAALREALVNAVAHRIYEDAGRKIILEVFADRVVVLSPGMPPAPITLPNLRKGKYRPCSRNPVLAQSLSYFHRIEERGSGFQRMREQMLNHGLNQPLIGADTGYFQVTFLGPGDNIDCIQVPQTQLLVTPAVEAQLNERQREMIKLMSEDKVLTSRQCEQMFSVTRPITSADFGKLVDLGLAERLGSGRSTRYRLKG